MKYSLNVLLVILTCFPLAWVIHTALNIFWFHGRDNFTLFFLLVTFYSAIPWLALLLWKFTQKNERFKATIILLSYVFSWCLIPILTSTSAFQNWID